VAIKSHDLELTLMLLEAGANPNVMHPRYDGPEGLNFYDETGFRASGSLVCMAIYEILYNDGGMAILEALLEHGANPSGVGNSMWDFPLYIAVREGGYEPDGYEPNYKRLEILDLLLEYGADINELRVVTTNHDEKSTVLEMSGFARGGFSQETRSWIKERGGVRVCLNRDGGKCPGGVDPAEALELLNELAQSADNANSSQSTGSFWSSEYDCEAIIKTMMGRDPTPNACDSDDCRVIVRAIRGDNPNVQSCVSRDCTTIVKQIARGEAFSSDCETNDCRLVVEQLKGSSQTASACSSRTCELMVLSAKGRTVSALDCGS